MSRARPQPNEPPASTQGTLEAYREMWGLAWPVSVSASTVMLLMVANLFWIGHLGTEAVAAVSLTSQILFMAYGLTQIVFSGAVAVVARRTGEQNHSEAYGSSVHAIVLGALLGIIVSVAGYFAASPLISFFEIEQSVSSIAIPYLEITFTGHVFFFVSMAVSASYQGTGNTRTPMILNAVVVGLNAVIDPVLIFRPGELVLGGLDIGVAGLGAVGAAVADVIASAIGCFVFLALYASKYGPFPGEVRSRVTVRASGLWQIARIGIPASVTMLARPLSTFFLLKVIASFGTTALAGFGIAVRAFSLNFIPFAGLHASVATLVGQRLGAGNPQRARLVVRHGLVIAVLLSIGLCVLYTGIAEPLIAIFDSDPAVIAVGVPFLMIIAFGQLFIGPTIPLGAAMNGAGDTRPPMFVALAANWPVKLPLAYALAIPFGLGTSGVWIGMFVSMILEATLLALWFRRGRWMTKAV
ncbi:MAG: MATE family efflux transporter [Candidatus Binatia bacterium]|nr:MATE family efflux transporter [Candidatus Binatia bacterium]